jgi:hypothetical protein
VTIFLIALAVGFVAAAVLWKLGQRTPPDPRDRKPRPRVAAVVQIVVALGYLYWTGTTALEAWTTLGDIAVQMRNGQVIDLAANADKIQDARGDLLFNGIFSAGLIGGLVFGLIPDLIKAFMRPATDASAKLQETHA